MQLSHKIIFLLLLVLAASFGYLARGLVDTSPASRQVREGGGRFTNPLLECEVAQGTINAPKIRFEGALEQKVDQIQTTYRALVSVYYRDLNNGPAFGVNADNSFAPASLLKVPVLIAFLKHAENEPGVLDRRLEYVAPQTAEYVQVFPSQQQLVPGNTYTVRELLERTIVYSDNEALQLLNGILSSAEYQKLFSIFGQSDFLSEGSPDLTVREYSTFFRVLFNASFLSQTSSEYALELLGRTTFVEGLRAGVPAAVPVAHKFGERSVNDQSIQVHDCGIVYHPKHPYLLCVMTRGDSPEGLTTAIKELSSFVYQKVDEQYGE